VRAALAGGLVFGITAGLTVASWTDAEFVGSTFTASCFGLQMSVNGAAYVPAGPVSVTALGIYPGSSGTRYVSLKVKTAAVSSGGTVSLSAPANGGSGLTPVLRTRIVSTTATCNSTAFTAGATYVAGGFAAYQMVSAALPSTPGIAVSADAASEIGYCIEISIATATSQATYQGTSGTVTYTVTGTSG
jgi:hypothetical protein